MEHFPIDHPRLHFRHSSLHSIHPVKYDDFNFSGVFAVAKTFPPAFNSASIDLRQVIAVASVPAEWVLLRTPDGKSPLNALHRSRNCLASPCLIKFKRARGRGRGRGKSISRISHDHSFQRLRGSGFHPGSKLLLRYNESGHTLRRRWRIIQLLIQTRLKA